MLMSVIINDAIANLSTASQQQLVNGSLDVVLYADDTLSIGESETRLQELIELLVDVEGRYGMELHWSNFQLLEVNAEYRLKATRDVGIHPRLVMSYLGGAPLMPTAK